VWVRNLAPRPPPPNANEGLKRLRQMDLEGKTFLVTGSTDGVGRLVASQIASQGAHVFVHGRNAERGQGLVDEIRAAGRGLARFLPANFS